MGINESIRVLWAERYFETHRKVKEIKGKLSKGYGINPSNLSVNLKSCKKFLRNETSGWIQRMRYESSNAPKLTKSKSRLLEYVTDSRLLNSCKLEFESGNYWDSVFKVLRHLEVRTRQKSKLTASEHGADLMEKAFKPNVGVLKIPTCATVGEEDGFKQIMKGMMMFHRNAKGHREESIDKNLALKIIGYTDYLLTILETAEHR